MRFIVKATLNRTKLKEFTGALERGELDSSCVKGETYCLKEEPAAGYNIWEAATREEFESKAHGWRIYCDSFEVTEIITPEEAMGLLLK